MPKQSEEEHEDALEEEEEETSRAEGDEDDTEAEEDVDGMNEEDSDAEYDEDAEDDLEEEEDEAEDEEEEEDEVPSVAVRSGRRTKKARARPPRSLAQLAGLPAGASTPAISGALHPLVSLARHVMAATGTKSTQAALGAFKAVMSDAAETGTLRKKLARQRRRNDARERMALLRKLSKAKVHPRGDLFVDSVDPVTGEKSIKPAKIWSAGEMKLSTLREYTKTKLKGAAPSPPPAHPQAPQGFGSAESAGVTAEDRKIAEKYGYDPKDVAASRNALFNDQGN